MSDKAETITALYQLGALADAVEILLFEEPTPKAVYAAWTVARLASTIAADAVEKPEVSQ